MLRTIQRMSHPIKEAIRSVSSVGAACDAEIFDVFDASNHGPIKQERRDVVHREGLWHRSVHVLLFHGTKTLVQQRAAEKDICPNHWDLSVGEHLQPNETYEVGAIRGLREELGVMLEEKDLEIVRDDPVPFCFKYGEVKKVDNEYVQCYKANYDGEVQPDGIEVAKVVWMEWKELLHNVKEGEMLITPWFRQELGLLQSK